MMTALKSLFTDKNDNLELASVITLLFALALVYFEFHHCVILGKDFDPQAFGWGAGGVAGGHGAAKLMGNKGDYGQ